MDRRLAGSYLDQPRQLSHSKLIIRVLLIAALVSSIILAALFYLPGETLLVDFWIYFVAAALPLVLLLAALGVKLHASIHSRVPRIIVVSLVAFFIMVIAVLVYSLSTVYAQVGANPAAYYTHPETRNRLLILKAVDLDSDPDDPDNYTYTYGAYPMKDKLFYYPNRGDAVKTKTGIDHVDWADGGMTALVYILDLEGNEQIITVSFAEPITEETSEPETDQDDAL